MSLTFRVTNNITDRDWVVHGQWRHKLSCPAKILGETLPANHRPWSGYKKRFHTGAPSRLSTVVVIVMCVNPHHDLILANLGVEFPFGVLTPPAR